MKRILTLLLATLLAGTSLWARRYQDEWDDEHRRLDWWLGASVGVTHSLAENATSNDMFKNYPGFDMQVGTFFSRNVGMRLSLGLNPQLARPGEAQRLGDPDKYDNYRFQVLTGYLDVMLDLTTLFVPQKRHRPTFDILLYVGGGGLEAFHYDKKVADWEYYPVDYWDKVYWGAHAGLMASYRFSPHWDWMIEGSYNVTDSKYDGVDSKVALSGYVKLHTGLVYHFFNRQSSNVRLTTDDDPGWMPGYTYDDRQRVKKFQHKQLERARKANAKRRADRAKEFQKRNEAAKKANDKLHKQKAKQAAATEEMRLYNER